MKKKGTKIYKGKKNSKTIGNKNLPYLSFTLLFGLGNIITIIVVLIFQKNLPPEIPLYYGLPRSTRQLATPPELIIPLIISLVVAFFNNSIAFLTKSDFLKKVLIIASYFIIAMAIITVIKIMLLVGTL